MKKKQTMEVIIECSVDCRGSKNVHGEPIREIVRCRDCRKWTNGDDVAGICQWNEYRTLQTWADSFCSFGERKGDDE